MQASEARTPSSQPQQPQPETRGTLLGGSEFLIRRYTPADREAVLKLRKRHDESLWFADPDDPVNFVTFLLEVDGKLVAAVTGRATIEGFLMIDRSFGEPADRLDVISRLIDAGVSHASSVGAREIHIGVNPQKRGWIRKLLSVIGAFDDDRHHVVISTLARNKH